MSDPDTELAAIFRDETLQRLDEMDAALLAVESGTAGAETIDALFRDAHTIKGSASMLGLEDTSTLAHAAENVLDAVRDAGTLPAELAAPLLRATSLLRALTEGRGEPIGDALADLEASRSLVPGASQPDGGRSPVRRGGGKHPAAEAGVPAARPPSGPASARPASGHGTVRVPAEKLDHLLNVVGEVTADRRRLGHALGSDSRLSNDLADLLGAGDRMLDELKDCAVGMRTLPLAVITGPLRRAVRDLARGAGKEVDFAVTGESTELDRVILESLSEPLTHLLRNAIEHGIEKPAEREAAGKPRRGRIEFRAEPQGGLVRITLTDDGRGISPEVSAEVRRTGSLVDVLTRPGYSTATEVTDLAGRGVGLDAVQAYVRSLGGSMDISSEPGNGLELGLLLPVALALAEVLIFERGAAVYGVPLAVVDEVVQVTGPLLLEGRPALTVRGQPLPVRDVAAILGAIAPALPHDPSALVVSAGGRRAVITCDRLLGQEEVVIKPLGPLFDEVSGYLGATMLRDGRIALLIEPAFLTHRPRTPPGLAQVTFPAEPAEPARRGPFKVLVVEDSFTVRELQRSILEAAGHQVTTARDGRDALAVLDQEPDIALVVTDIEMPVLDGLELTRAIRANPERSSLPVVVVTSHASAEAKREGLAAGADAFMVKREFDQEALLATVERLAGR